MGSGYGIFMTRPESRREREKREEGKKRRKRRNIWHDGRRGETPSWDCVFLDGDGGLVGEINLLDPVFGHKGDGHDVAVKMPGLAFSWSGHPMYHPKKRPVFSAKRCYSAFLHLLDCTGEYGNAVKVHNILVWYGEGSDRGELFVVHVWAVDVLKKAQDVLKHLDVYDQEGRKGHTANRVGQEQEEGCASNVALQPLDKFGSPSDAMWLALYSQFMQAFATHDGDRQRQYELFNRGSGPGRGRSREDQAQHGSDPPSLLHEAGNNLAKGRSFSCLEVLAGMAVVAWISEVERARV
ncbi:hypothetical protein BJ684DRAFT_17288, partial [Piptocephalis cylindrospora]